MSEYKLSKGIIALSQASKWSQAKLEWQLDHIYKEEEPDTCLCGHYPINEICILKNKLNEATTRYYFFYHLWADLNSEACLY